MPRSYGIVFIVPISLQFYVVVSKEFFFFAHGSIDYR